MCRKAKSSFFNQDLIHRRIKCPMCLNRKMSSFPILPNEVFTFNYNNKRGVDLEFRPRKKKNNNNEKPTQQ